MLIIWLSLCYKIIIIGPTRWIAFFAWHLDCLLKSPYICFIFHSFVSSLSARDCVMETEICDCIWQHLIHCSDCVLSHITYSHYTLCSSWDLSHVNLKSTLKESQRSVNLFFLYIIDIIFFLCVVVKLIITINFVSLCP